MELPGYIEGNAVFFLVYVSAAVTWFSSAELRALLVKCRAHNERAGISGILLYKDGNFMQVLEGPESEVQALYKRIAADRRHRGMLTIDSGTAEARQFEGWSMAFQDLGVGADALPAGYSEFLDLPLTDPAYTDTPSRCQQLLQVFKSIQ